MSEPFRKFDDNFGGSMSWKTQPNCRVFDESGPWFNSWRMSRFTTSCPVLSWLSSRFTTGCPVLNHSWSCRTSILEGATFHRMNWCKFLWGNPCKAIATFYHWDFGFSTLSFHPVAWKNSETDSAVTFCARLLTSWRKLQLSPSEHCPLVSHCQQSPRILCSRCFTP